MGDPERAKPLSIPRTASVLVLALLMSLPILFTGAEGAVTAGAVSSLTLSGQRIHENSTALPVFGIGAVSSTGLDTIDRVNVTLVNQGGFVLSDLAPPSANASISGVAIYRDDGDVDDDLDRGDTPMHLSSIGRVGSTYILNLSSESVPTSQTGSFTWIVVVRTSATIGPTDAFQIRIESAGVLFSDGSTSPSSARTTDTITCYRSYALPIGEGSLIPIGEHGAEISSRALIGFSIISPSGTSLTLEGLDMVLGNISGFDPEMDLLSGDGISVYADDGPGSNDVWDPLNDTKLTQLSSNVTDIGGGLYRASIIFHHSGANAYTLPSSSTAGIVGFIVISASENIGNRDRFNLTLKNWGMNVRGDDNETRGCLPQDAVSRTVQADTLPPGLEGAILTVTSDSIHFLDNDTDLQGRDSIFFNSASGEGSGQTIRVRFRGYNEDFPDELRGEPAFNQRPNGPVDGTDSTDQTVAYTITSGNYADNPVTFTLKDKVGHTTTWDIYMIEDNVKPVVTDLDISSSSEYIHGDAQEKKVYFRTLMPSPHYFHITGSSNDPSGGSGLQKVEFSIENDLYSSPPTDYTPGSFNGSYGVSSSSRSSDGILHVDVYDKVNNRARTTIEYRRITAYPSVSVLRPEDPGENVSGTYRLMAEVSSPAPLRDVSFSSDSGSSYKDMSYFGSGTSGDIYISDWSTVSSQEGPLALRFRARDLIGGDEFSLTWVNVDNYPLTGRIDLPVDGSAVSGEIDVRLAVSSFCTSLKLYLGSSLIASRTGPFSGGAVTIPLNTALSNDGVHLLKANFYGFGGEEIERSSQVTIDNTPPTLSSFEIVFPRGRSAANVGDRIRIRAEIHDAGSGLMDTYAVANSIGGSVFERLYDDGEHGDGSNGDGLFSTSEIAVDAAWAFHRVQIIVRDRAGNLVNRTMLVAVDPNPPLIEDSWISYTDGNTASKTGDKVQVFAQASDNTAPIYVTLVLDNSGSMRGEKMSSLKVAAQAFINQTRDFDYLSLYRFSSGTMGMPPGEPMRILNFTLMNDTGKENARKLVRGLIANSPTPIWDTIGEAITYTLNNGRSYPVVVAFTDGADDYNGDTIFEEGSGHYCPWHEWGTNKTYSRHLGKYYYSGGALYPAGNYWIYNDLDVNYRTRKGLLYSPIPVYTIGLGLEHHDPPNKPERTAAPSNFAQDSTAYYPGGDESGTTEYNLWRIATTSAGGTYSYAPSETQLSVIFRNLASSIFNTENPSRIDRLVATLPFGTTMEVELFDDGLHGDDLAGDGMYASMPISVPSIEEGPSTVFLQVIDWAGNVGFGEATMIVDNTPPIVFNVTLYYPEGAYSVADGELFHLTLEARDPLSGIMAASAVGTDLGIMNVIQFNDDGMGNDAFAGDGIYTSGPLTPSTGSSPAGFRSLEINVRDGAGNANRIRYHVRVVNDREAPLVEMINPSSVPFLSGYDTIKALVVDDGEIQAVRYYLKDPSGVMVKQGIMRSAGGDNYEVPVDLFSLQEAYHTLEVVATDTSGRQGSSGEITVGIDKYPPEFQLLEPFNRSAVSGVASFRFTASDPFLDGVFYSIDGGPSIRVEDGLDTRLYSQGIHNVRVFARDLSGKTRSFELVLYFDNSDPQVTLIQPVEDQFIGTGQQFVVRAFDGGGLGYARIYLYPWGPRIEPTPPLDYEKPIHSQFLSGPEQDGIVLAADFKGLLGEDTGPDGRYLLVAEVVDRSGRSGFAYISVYLDDSPPAIVVLYPEEGQRLEGSITPNIVATDGNLNEVHVLFRGRMYEPDRSIDLTGIPEGAYTFSVVASDMAGRSTRLDREVFIDSEPPRISVMSPGDGMTFRDTMSVMALIEDGSGIKLATLIVDGFEMVTGSPVGYDGLYVFTLDLGPMNMSLHRFRVRAVDRAGLVSNSEERIFFNRMWDSDGDGVLDPYDDEPFNPLVHGDYDGDGFGSLYDDDDDGDGVPDILEPPYMSLYPDGTSKGIPFSLDPTEWKDTDGDGIGDNSDPDIDGDGVPNELDAFPYDPTEWRDTDGDGIGDNSDPDIDGDGVPNELDAFPYDPTEWRDTDGDGIGDNSDPDIDGDGVMNERDHFPYNRKRHFYWEPYIFSAFIILVCTSVLFIGLVFKNRISGSFDRSWDEGALFRLRGSIKERLSRNQPPKGPPEGPKKPGAGTPHRGVGPGTEERPPPSRRKGSPVRERKAPPSRKSKKEDLQEFEEYKEEQVGSHRVRWSSR